MSDACFPEVKECICGLGSRLRIVRAQAGVYDQNGRWVEGAPQLLDVLAVVQPLASHEVVLLPEGKRTKGSVKLYTTSRLQAADVKAQLQADRFCWHGDEYELFSVDDQSTYGGYYKGIAVEVGQ